MVSNYSNLDYLIAGMIIASATLTITFGLTVIVVEGFVRPHKKKRKNK